MFLALRRRPLTRFRFAGQPEEMHAVVQWISEPRSVDDQSETRHLAVGVVERAAKRRRYFVSRTRLRLLLAKLRE